MTHTHDLLSVYFTRQHREADDFWGELERVSDNGDNDALAAAFAAFDQSVRGHLRSEEQVLFPAFEHATGMTQGPTVVMMLEHEQLRGLLGQMRAALNSGDSEALLELGDTFNTLVQQHNMKEERMLYRMCEQALGDSWPDMYAQLESSQTQR